MCSVDLHLLTVGPRTVLLAPPCCCQDSPIRSRQWLRCFWMPSKHSNNIKGRVYVQCTIVSGFCVDMMAHWVAGCILFIFGGLVFIGLEPDVSNQARMHDTYFQP